MKLLFFLLLIPVCVNSQSLIIGSDSTSVLFPNQLKLSLAKNKIGATTYFQMDRKAFKAFILTTNFYLQSNSISLENVELLLKNQAIFDSTYAVMNEKFKIEHERTALYKTAFEDMKLVSASYDQQLLKCATDLSDLKKQKDKSKTIGFIKGLLWGTGVLGGIFALSSIN
jgi:hypothetical protein